MTQPYDDEPPVEPPAEPADDAKADPSPPDGARREAELRRRLDEVFGEVLPTNPEAGADEPAAPPGTAPRDEEIRREVPPHY